MKLDLCMRCGSVVEDHPDAKQMHTKFHEEIDELIDWAQAVSQSILDWPGEKPDKIGKMLGPNPGLEK